MNDDTSKHGYWLYGDGSSFWGLGLNRNNEAPMECTPEIHREADVNKKLEWRTAKLAEIAKKKKLEDAAKR